MANIATLPIVADRYGACVRQVYIVGLDLTAVDMRAQVRLGGDVPGVPLVDLLTVTNGNAQGLRLVGVETVGGLPTSHVELVVNERAMEGLPYTGERGGATELAWDWQVVINARKRRIAKGAFVITGDGVTGADTAPSNRPYAYGGGQRFSGGTWSSAKLTFGDDSVRVQIDGADLVAPLTKRATDAADQAARDLVGTTADKVETSQYASAASALANRYLTFAAGSAASAAGVDFTVVAADGKWINVYRKGTSADADHPLIQLPGKAAYAGPGGADLIGFQPEIGPWLSLSGFLDRQGTWASDSTEIQEALDHLATKQGFQPLKIAPGLNIIMPDRSIVVDGSYTYIESNGSKFSWPDLTEKPALLIRGSANPPYLQGVNIFDRLILNGPGTFGNPLGTTAGVRFDGIQGGEFGPSHISLINSIVRGFGTGTQHGHNSYLNHNRNVRILDCDVGIEVYGSIQNATENLRYTDGVVFNCRLGVRQADASGSGTLTLVGVSFDYLRKFAEVNSRALLKFESCWHESNNLYTGRPITYAPGPDGLQDGAALLWDGGRFLMASAPSDFDYWAEVPAGAACHIRPDFATRTRTSTGIAFAGAGESSFAPRWSYDAHGNNIVSHPTKYGMLDGDMSNPAVVDWFIVSGGATQSSEIDSANLKLSKTTDMVLPGATRSLKVTKTSGRGSPATFAGIVPVKEGQVIGRRLFWRKAGSQGGDIYVSMRFGTVGYDAEGRRKLQYADTAAGDVSITLPAGDSGWQLIETPGANLGPNRVPGGANYAIILVIMNNADAGDFNIGRAWMGEMQCK